MTTWGEFAESAPDVAARARALLYRTGSGEALLATVRNDAPPRINPIAVAVVDGGLYAFVLPSPKLTDLEQDGQGVAVRAAEGQAVGQVGRDAG
jgi:hypothetical protein